jgi:hypothetical protein
LNHDLSIAREGFRDRWKRTHCQNIPNPFRADCIIPGIGLNVKIYGVISDPSDTLGLSFPNRSNGVIERGLPLWNPLAVMLSNDIFGVCEQRGDVGDRQTSH